MLLLVHPMWSRRRISPRLRLHDDHRQGGGLSEPGCDVHQRGQSTDAGGRCLLLLLVQGLHELVVGVGVCLTIIDDELGELVEARHDLGVVVWHWRVVLLPSPPLPCQQSVSQSVSSMGERFSSPS